MHIMHIMLFVKYHACYHADFGKRGPSSELITLPSFAGEQVAFYFLQIEVICAGRLDVA